MPLSSGLFTSNNSEWETPQHIFDVINTVEQLTLDVCASESNFKLPHYFTKETNGLAQSWGGNSCWMNPPYGREISDWILKAHDEWIENNIKIVMLLPARTDTKWFHNWLVKDAEVKFIKGRLHFSNSKDSAPFPSMIATYRPRWDF